MFPLSPTMWVAVGGALLVVGLGAAVKIQSSRLETSKAETIAVQGKFDAFVAQAKALGDAQNAKAKLKVKVDETAAKSRTDLAALYAKYRGLRNSAAASAGSGQLPPAAAVTSSAARTCFDTAKLVAAMGRLETGVPGIVEQGDVARLRLSSAAEWAASLAR
jgi:hypothetical protein